MYVLSTTPEIESHWMTFDVNTQNWTLHANKLSFFMNCCSGRIVTVRGFHYFFEQLFYVLNPLHDSNPIISRILPNGTVVDLNVAKQPYESHFEDSSGSFRGAGTYKDMGTCPNHISKQSLENILFMNIVPTKFMTEVFKSQVSSNMSRRHCSFVLAPFYQRSYQEIHL